MRAGIRLLVLGSLFIAACVLPIPASASVVATGDPASTVEHRETAPDGNEFASDETDLACPTRVASPERSQPPKRARIAELYPNPTIPDNSGEFFVLETPRNASIGNWTVTDGHTTAAFPNETVSGRVAVSTEPELTRTLTDDPVVELEGHLRLAVDGDRLEIAADGERIDSVAYDRAPQAEVWYRTDGADTEGADGTGRWWPRDATCLPVSTADVAEATAFVQPDETEIPLETLRDADDRILLAGYTFTSEAVTAELLAAVERGVDVRVLLEAGPVGGTPAATRDRLDELEEAGASVHLVGGEGARYRFHHPKYAVADDVALVTTENWKPAGVGGAASRGWGVRVRQPALAADLAAVFESDVDGWDVESWESYRDGATFVDDQPERDEFPTHHEPETVAVDGVELLVAPENAEGRLVELLAAADEEVLITQPRITSDVSLLEAAVEAARRGVEVRILLDSTWYVESENDALAADLEAAAADDDLPLEVRLVEPDARFERIHAKGLVVDGETAVVGSANWNNNSLRNNREVLLALHGEEAAAYYAAVFYDDWSSGTWSLPVELLGVVAAALLGAGYVGRKRIAFESGVSSRAGSHSRVLRRDRPPPSSGPGRR